MSGHHVPQNRRLRQLLEDQFQRGLEQGRREGLDDGAPRMLGMAIIICISTVIGFVIGLSIGAVGG